MIEDILHELMGVATLVLIWISEFLLMLVTNTQYACKKLIEIDNRLKRKQTRDYLQWIDDEVTRRLKESGIIKKHDNTK